MDVAVLIVSYRRADLLARCLASVDRWLPAADVHVWDNASDGSDDVRRLADGRQDLSWTFCEDNIGFARAVNRLVARVDPARDLLLLNPDAELVGDLTVTRATLARQGVAAAAPFVVGTREDVPWDNAHLPPTLLRSLVSHAGYAGGRLRGSLISDLYRRPPDGNVGYLTGSCMLVSRAAWEDVGPFDERYFLYAEEADWAARARRRGWRLVLAHERGARHVAAGTVADHPGYASRSTELLLDSQTRYLRDHHGPIASHLYTAGTRVMARIQRSKRASLQVRDATRAGSPGRAL